MLRNPGRAAEICCGVALSHARFVANAGRQQLRAVSDELERSNLELVGFATIASHDLQEPLRKIQAFGDRLAEHSAGALDEEATDYLRRMTNAAARMQSLINDLLEYSQVVTRPEPPQPVDLGLVVAEVLSDLDERIRVTKGEIHVGPLPTILASPLQVRQLFQNLIANALKFHPPGVAPEVHIEAASRGSSRGPKGRRDRATPVWEIRVRDNGIGFDDKHAEKIFTPFQRLNGRQAYEGTGMGLAICRRIAAFLGGTITATARPGGSGARAAGARPRVARAEHAGPVAGCADQQRRQVADVLQLVVRVAAVGGGGGTDGVGIDTIGVVAGDEGRGGNGSGSIERGAAPG